MEHFALWKSLSENRNWQPGYDALQKPKHQPKSF